MHVVAGYLRWMATRGLAESSIRVAKAAIASMQPDEGLAMNERRGSVACALREIHRVWGKPPVRQDALTRAGVAALADSFGSDRSGIRHRAMMLVHFECGFRPSEVLALDLCDLRGLDSSSVGLWLARSKTDQAGVGRLVAMDASGSRYCAVRALKEWVAVRGTMPGPLFSSDSGCRLHATNWRKVFRSAKKRLGWENLKITGMSLRAGFATDAVRRGVDPRLIADRLGHASIGMTECYIRSDLDRSAVVGGAL